MFVSNLLCFINTVLASHCTRWRDGCGQLSGFALTHSHNKYFSSEFILLFLFILSFVLFYFILAWVNEEKKIVYTSVLFYCEEDNEGKKIYIKGTVYIK